MYSYFCQAEFMSISENSEIWKKILQNLFYVTSFYNSTWLYKDLLYVARKICLSKTHTDLYLVMKKEASDIIQE